MQARTEQEPPELADAFPPDGDIGDAIDAAIGDAPPDEWNATVVRPQCCQCQFPCLLRAGWVRVSHVMFSSSILTFSHAPHTCQCMLFRVHHLQ